MRPFRPGGDYQAENYSAPCCVVDNPPFSIMAQILDFYQSRQIPFFLFAPQMTIFCTVLRRTGVTFVSANIDIIYTNGARVKTAFVTNMSPELVFTTSPQLHNAISIANISSAKKTPKIELSPNIFSAKYIQKISTGENINFQLKWNQIVPHNKCSKALKRLGRGACLIPDKKVSEIKRLTIKAEDFMIIRAKERKNIEPDEYITLEPHDQALLDQLNLRTS